MKFENNFKKSIIVWTILILLQIFAIFVLFNKNFSYTYSNNIFYFLIIIAVFLSYYYGGKNLFGGIISNFVFLVIFLIVFFLLDTIFNIYKEPVDVLDILVLFGFSLYSLIGSVIFSVIFYFVLKKRKKLK